MSDRLHLALWTCGPCGRECYTSCPRETGAWQDVEPRYCPYCGVHGGPFTCRATVLCEQRMAAHQPSVAPLLGEWPDPIDTGP